MISPHLYQIWHLYLHLCDCTKRLALPVSLIIADNCNALGLIPPPAGRSISVGLISYANYGAVVKFLICHSLLLSLDEELADLSLPLAFFHLRNSCFKKLAKKLFPVNNID